MTLDDSLRAGIRKDQMCQEAFLGEFLVPRHISTLNGYCSSVFVNNTEACLIISMTSLWLTDRTPLFASKL